MSNNSDSISDRFRRFQEAGNSSGGTTRSSRDEHVFEEDGVNWVDNAELGSQDSRTQTRSSQRTSTFDRLLESHANEEAPRGTPRTPRRALNLDNDSIQSRSPSRHFPTSDPDEVGPINSLAREQVDIDDGRRSQLLTRDMNNRDDPRRRYSSQVSSLLQNSTPVRNRTGVRYDPYTPRRLPRAFDNAYQEDSNEDYFEPVNATVSRRPRENLPIYRTRGPVDAVSSRLAQAGTPFVPIRSGPRPSTKLREPFTAHVCILVSRKSIRIPCASVSRELTSLGLGDQNVTLVYGDLKSLNDQLAANFPVLSTGPWQGVVGPKKPQHELFPCQDGDEGLKSEGLPNPVLWWKKKSAVLYIRPIQEFPLVSNLFDEIDCVHCYLVPDSDDSSYSTSLQLNMKMPTVENENKLNAALGRLKTEESISFDAIADTFFNMVDTEAVKMQYRNPVSVPANASLSEVLEVFSVAGVAPLHDFVTFTFQDSIGFGDGPHAEVMTLLKSVIASRAFECHGGRLLLSPSLYMMAEKAEDEGRETNLSNCFVMLGSILARLVLNGGRGPVGLHPALKQALLVGQVTWDDPEVLAEPVFLPNSPTITEAIATLQKWIETKQWPSFSDRQIVQACCVKSSIDCEIFRRVEDPKELLARLLFDNLLKPFAKEIQDFRAGLQKHGVLSMLKEYPSLGNTVFPRLEKLTANRIMSHILPTPPTVIDKIRPILTFLEEEGALQQLLIVWTGKDYLDSVLKLTALYNCEYAVKISSCAESISVGENVTVDDFFKDLDYAMKNPHYNSG